MTEQTERQAAILDLVSRPDQDGYSRSHRVTCDGDPDRFRVYQDLPVRYVNLHRAERSCE